jgi:hypothetical protein
MLSYLHEAPCSRKKSRSNQHHVGAEFHVSRASGFARDRVEACSSTSASWSGVSHWSMPPLCWTYEGGLAPVCLRFANAACTRSTSFVLRS